MTVVKTMLRGERGMNPVAIIIELATPCSQVLYASDGATGNRAVRKKASINNQTSDICLLVNSSIQSLSNSK